MILDTQEIYFYTQKGKIFAAFIFSFTFFMLWLAPCIYFFKEGSIIEGFSVAILPLAFGVSSLLVFKMLIDVKPYLTLTKETLIIKHPLKRAIHLKWQDIEKYEMWKANLTHSIDIYLADKGEYKGLHKQSFVRNRFMKRLQIDDISPIIKANFTLGLIKRKDRPKLLKELDWRTFRTKEEELIREKEKNRQLYGEEIADRFSPKKLSDQKKEEAVQLEQYSQINRKYILKITAISFIITVGISFFLYQTEGDNFYNESMPIMIVWFILYPIARIIYDIAGGFKLSFKIKESATPHLEKLELIIHVFILYILSLIVIPVGAIYLLVRAVVRRLLKQ
ncbi:STM3941 family protein [Oceanobacillus jeddahense]|uniref:STM3941 family protein n=1 Tax=Oceanobacillus jeddahense TaxID=1462527 RepID=UPI0030B87AAC